MRGFVHDRGGGLLGIRTVPYVMIKVEGAPPELTVCISGGTMRYGVMSVFMLLTFILMDFREDRFEQCVRVEEYIQNLWYLS